MPAQTSMLHVRVDDQLKTKAADTLSLALEGALDESLRQGMVARRRSGPRRKPIEPYTESNCV